jgi:chromosome segregation ATPase
MSARRRDGNGAASLFEKLKSAPEWAKNAAAIGAVVLAVLGVRMDVSNLRSDQDVLDARQDRIAERVASNEAQIEGLNRDLDRTDRKATNVRAYVKDIQQDLDEILEAIQAVSGEART